MLRRDEELKLTKTLQPQCRKGARTQKVYGGGGDTGCNVTFEFTMSGISFVVEIPVSICKRCRQFRMGLRDGRFDASLCRRVCVRMCDVRSYFCGRVREACHGVPSIHRECIEGWRECKMGRCGTCGSFKRRPEWKRVRATLTTSLHLTSCIGQSQVCWNAMWQPLSMTRCSLTR